MDQVDSVHFSLSDIRQEIIKPLSIMLMQNQKIRIIYFKGHGRNIDKNHITNIISALLLIPKKITYHFDSSVLSNLSVDLLNSQFNEDSITNIQKCCPKTVVTLVDNYVNNPWDMKNYYAVCKSPMYSKIFKASYIDHVNEKEQQRHLQEMLNVSIAKQLEEMQTILRKEDSSHKHLSIYGHKFSEIDNVLRQQANLGYQKGIDPLSIEEAYNKLEAQKIELMKAMIDRLS